MIYENSVKSTMNQTPFHMDCLQEKKGVKITATHQSVIRWDSRETYSGRAIASFRWKQEYRKTAKESLSSALTNMVSNAIIK